METSGRTFIAGLKSALLGAANAPLVFLGNFEVEEQWAKGEIGLPKVSFKSSSAVVNRMDEFTLLMAGKGDHVLLKEAPDEDFLAYLGGLGLDLPQVHTVQWQDPHRVVTGDVLADAGLLAELSRLADQGAQLAPHGVSAMEEELSERAALPLAAPAATTCKAVNSKVYSRRIADRLGLRQVHGWACENLSELQEAVDGANALLAAGGRVVVKDAFGVSGKGIAVVDAPARLDQIRRLVERSARRAGRDDIGMVIEEWVAKRADLNYQFTIARDGGVQFDFVKEAITENNVHKGHRIPARLNANQVAGLEHSAQALGSRLAADGYFGVVGVDALVEPDGGIYPVLEINARNNMSTYQVPLQEAFLGTGLVAYARQYPLRLTRRLAFDELRPMLDELVFDRDRATGLLVTNYATVNAAVSASAAPDGGFDGRLYGLLMARSQDELDAMDQLIVQRLTATERISI